MGGSFTLQNLCTAHSLLLPPMRIAIQLTFCHIICTVIINNYTTLASLLVSSGKSWVLCSMHFHIYHKCREGRIICGMRQYGTLLMRNFHPRWDVFPKGIPLVFTILPSNMICIKSLNTLNFHLPRGWFKDARHDMSNFQWASYFCNHDGPTFRAQAVTHFTTVSTDHFYTATSHLLPTEEIFGLVTFIPRFTHSL